MSFERALWASLLTVGVATSLQAQLATTEVVRGLDSPVAIVADPADRELLFLVEQGGLIRLARGNTLLDEPFLDLRPVVSSDGERGLLGMALAPDFAESGRFFVNFTDRQGDTVVARFTRSLENARHANPDSRFDFRWPDGRRVIDQPFPNHNGGHLAFGRDGYFI